MSDLICRNTMMRCQTPGMCSPHGGCRAPERPPVQVISIEAPGVTVEKDLFGTVRIKLNYEGGEPFDFVQIQYDHRFTHNSHQHSLAQRIVAAISGVDPERDQLKAECEALRLDAERYRAIRDCDEIFIRYTDGNDIHLIREPEQLNALADAAISKDGQR